MPLTKKDFEAIAKALAEGWPEPGHPGHMGYARAVNAVAKGLAQTNPAFDTERFKSACCRDVPPAT